MEFETEQRSASLTYSISRAPILQLRHGFASQKAQPLEINRFSSQAILLPLSGWQQRFYPQLKTRLHEREQPGHRPHVAPVSQLLCHHTLPRIRRGLGDRLSLLEDLEASWVHL